MANDRNVKSAFLLATIQSEKVYRIRSKCSSIFERMRKSIMLIRSHDKKRFSFSSRIFMSPGKSTKPHITLNLLRAMCDKGDAFCVTLLFFCLLEWKWKTPSTGGSYVWTGCECALDAEISLKQQCIIPNRFLFVLSCWACTF